MVRGELDGRAVFYHQAELITTCLDSRWPPRQWITVTSGTRVSGDALQVLSHQPQLCPSINHSRLFLAVPILLCKSSFTYHFPQSISMGCSNAMTNRLKSLSDTLAFPNYDLDCHQWRRHHQCFLFVIKVKKTNIPVIHPQKISCWKYLYLQISG